jgi:hypothetical protein
MMRIMGDTTGDCTARERKAMNKGGPEPVGSISVADHYFEEIPLDIWDFVCFDGNGKTLSDDLAGDKTDDPSST